MRATWSIVERAEDEEYDLCNIKSPQDSSLKSKRIATSALVEERSRSTSVESVTEIASSTHKEN